MAYFTFVKAAFSSAVNSVITEVGANPPAALPLRHDPPGIHTVYPAAMWMRPHSTKQMQAIMAAASLTVGAGMNENEGKNENKRGAVRKKIDQRVPVVETKRMIRVTETKRMMATNKPGVVQMKGGAYVILIILLYVDISISIRYSKKTEIVWSVFVSGEFG